MNNILIFIIAGKSRAGKDTTAKIIKNYAHSNNLKCINLQFSSYIKMYAKLITNWDGYDENKPRTLLQDLGSEIRNNIGNNFFINRIIDDINVLKKYVDIITISDSRLPNELDLVSNSFSNCYKVKIIRPNYDNNLIGAQKSHITETALDNYHNFDFIINNDGTIKDLEIKTKELLLNIIKNDV